MNKLLIGFSAGLLLGILFAPAKGSETRESISNRGRDLKDKFNDLVDSITDKFDLMKEDAEDLAEQGRQRVKSF
ncbi:MAG: YtxH domain-containing protein [Chitinophagaceae bacterium]